MLGIKTRHSAHQGSYINIMVLLVVFTLLVSAFADKLDNTYLPPANAGGAGGNSKFLDVPSQFGVRQQGSGYTRISSSEQQYARKPPINILRYENANDGLGHYAYNYETENQINVQESNELKNVGTPNEINVVRGYYSYPGPDGNFYKVNYVVDENGFQASGAHLPTPPPIPEAILKSLEYNAQHPEEEQEEQQNNQAPPSIRYRSQGSQSSFNAQSGYRY